MAVCGPPEFVSALIRPNSRNGGILAFLALHSGLTLLRIPGALSHSFLRSLQSKV